MDTSSMKNIVVLRDLPSNLVEEAIVVLKENQKLKKVELLDMETEKGKEKKQEEKKNRNKEMIEKKAKEKNENQKDYIIKEAQLLISDYITRIEGKSKSKNTEKSFTQLKKKYHKLKIVNIALVCALMLSIFLSI